MEIAMRLLMSAIGWMSAALLVCAGPALASEPPTSFAKDCALKETEIITFLEDHGEADDVPHDQLARAGLTLMDARMTCYEGRAREALELYNRILDLGAVVWLPRPR
jgi:hypothetical protein